MAKVGVVIPVLNRPGRVLPFVKAFRESCTPEQAALYIVAQSDDKAELDEIQRAANAHMDIFNGINLLIVQPENRSWAKKVNEAFANSDEPWLLLGGDDLNFAPGWFEKLEPYLSDKCGVIGTSDVEQEDGDRSSCHPVVSRDYISTKGGTVDGGPGVVVHDGYDHNYPDTELAAVAHLRGMYVFAPDVTIEHLHPFRGKGEPDDTYKLGSRNFAKDKALFKARAKKFGFSDA